MNDPRYRQPNWQEFGGYYPQHHYHLNDPDPFARQGSKTLAVLSAVLGLGLAAVLSWQGLDLMTRLGGAAGLAGTWPLAYLVVSGVVLMGAVLVFARVLAGAFILAAGALVAFSGLVLGPLVVPEITPLLAGPLSRHGYADYFRAVFAFDSQLAIRQLVGIVLAFLVASGAVLRPARDWLRRRRDDDVPPSEWEDWPAGQARSR